MQIQLKLLSASIRQLRTHWALVLLLFPATISLAQDSVKFATADGKPEAFHFLEPGFTVRELQVRLNAINNLVYAPDGRLFAVGYDGRIHILRDTNGDGLEDKATLFWKGKGDYSMPLGLVLRDDAVYITLRRRIERLRDTNGDDKADEMKIVATGWHEAITETDTTFKHRRVDDAIGLAMDKDGVLYTSLGTPNYENSWQLNEKGVPQYSREQFRGSVLRIGADGVPERIASGVRFAVSMQFNRHGDLFATDQEGYTWGPGNPFDKLIQILPGRHYAFPPRHEKFLPDVIDEPGVVDVTPMHQSMCGFFFNEERSGFQRFGPAHWEGDAIVTGMSRGKLWRLPLAKTRDGYAGRAVLIGSVNLLPIDTCLSPAGDIVVACHSGNPDWGLGPLAEGRLYKISNTSPKEPRLSIVWPETLTRVIAAFNEPLPVDAKWEAEIIGGRYLRAGDEMEAYRPGYKIISDEQKVAPTHQVIVNSAELSSDRRDLILSTAPHPWQCNYTLKLHWTSARTGGEGTVYADYSFRGVRAEWTPKDAKKAVWTGWLPHPNLDVAASFTLGSARHEAFFKQIEKPGTLHIGGQLMPRDLAQRQEIDAMTRVVKNGNSTLPPDPAERTLTALASVEGSWTLGDGKSDIVKGKPSPLERQENEVNVPFSITLTTGAGMSLTFTTHSQFDPHERPLAPPFVLTPDAPVLVAPGAPVTSEKGPKFTAGDVGKGAVIFKTACAICHTLRGEGRSVGPDLSNSPERDIAALRQDILHPNAALNPDYLAFEIDKKDGNSLVGVVASDRPGRFLIQQAAIDPVEVLFDDIKEMRQMPISLMPEGFESLGEEALRDLLTYLSSRVSENPK
jgi:putative heme-binding domain-containing protein